MERCYLHLRWYFVNISEVNRQVIYRTRSAGLNISQYIESTQQQITLHCYALQYITLQSKRESISSNNNLHIWPFSNITIQFYFLLCSFNSYLKTISINQSSTNFCTDNMAESFVDPKMVLNNNLYQFRAVFTTGLFSCWQWWPFWIYHFRFFCSALPKTMCVF